VLDEQGELQATVSQMRDELKAKDAELTKVKPDHRPSFWSELKLVRCIRVDKAVSIRQLKQKAVVCFSLPLQVSDTGRPTYEGLKQKLAEKDAQLDEALAIIKELSQAMQGKAAPATPGGCPTCGAGAPPAPPAATAAVPSSTDAPVDDGGEVRPSDDAALPRLVLRHEYKRRLMMTGMMMRQPLHQGHPCSGCAHRLLDRGLRCTNALVCR
jgi:hypothetical protein